VVRLSVAAIVARSLVPVSPAGSVNDANASLAVHENGDGCTRWLQRGQSGVVLMVEA